MSNADDLYPITDRLRCQYMGRDFSGKMEVMLPTAIMLEAADRIAVLEENNFKLREALEKIADTVTLYGCPSPESIIARTALEEK